MTFPNFIFKTTQVAPTPCRMYRLDSNHKRVKTSEHHYNARNPGADKNSQLLQAGKNKTMDPSNPKVSNGSLRERLIGLGMLLLGAAGIAAIIITGPVAMGILGSIVTYMIILNCLGLIAGGGTAIVNPRTNC